MLAPLETSAVLLARLSGLASQIPWRDDRGIVSVVLELPPSAIRNTFTGNHQWFHFSRPDSGHSRLGSGEAYRAHFEGERRFSQMRDTAHRLASNWVTLDPDETGIQPSALVLFAHYARDRTRPAEKILPNSLLWVPSLLLQETENTAVAIFNVALPAEPTQALNRWRQQLTRLLAHQGAPRRAAHLHRFHERPSRHEWQQRVDQALCAIRETDVEKVVLTRQIQVRGERPFDPQRLHAAQAYLFPDCQIVQIREGEQMFAAATPERLISLDKGRLQVDAIAGTTGRAAKPRDDQRLAEALLSSPKQRHEHDLVVRAIRERLWPLTEALEIPAEPRLRQLSNVQHLWTPITGRAGKGEDLLSLAAALHPTPATAGYPPALASQWLWQQDDFARGWYTGAAGWLTPTMEGELWVLLRCALLHGDTALLSAGAGITAESNPDEEWHETEDKLGGMLAALQYA